VTVTSLSAADSSPFVADTGCPSHGLAIGEMTFGGSLAPKRFERHHGLHVTPVTGRRGRRTCYPREVTVPTRGVVYVHSTPLAVCPHVEWAIARALAAPVSLHWDAQPLDPGARRAEFRWTGQPGTGAAIAGELKKWQMVRFEVTEEPSPGLDGERFMHVPGRGLFRATTGVAGDIQVGEHQLRALLAQSREPEALAHALDTVLGTAWDADLEPYRCAAEEPPLSALPRVG
jgi:hypothetical protein